MSRKYDTKKIYFKEFGKKFKEISANELEQFYLYKKFKIGNRIKLYYLRKDKLGNIIKEINTPDSRVKKIKLDRNQRKALFFRNKYNEARFEEKRLRKRKPRQKKYLLRKDLLKMKIRKWDHWEYELEYFHLTEEKLSEIKDNFKLNNFVLTRSKTRRFNSSFVLVECGEYYDLFHKKQILNAMKYICETGREILYI